MDDDLNNDLNNNRNNENGNLDEEYNADEIRREARNWNDVWDAFINPNLERFPFYNSICDCEDNGNAEGYYVANGKIYCLECETKIAPYRICPHTKTEEFFEYDDNQDNDYIIKKCHLCEKILEHNDEFLYYLRIACTHDFRHVGVLDDEDLGEGQSYCFQCARFI